MEIKLNQITEKNIEAACDRHGAKVVSDAAYKRIAGDHQSLPKIGLIDPVTLDEANKVATIAFALMEPDDRATDLAEATIASAKIGLY